MKGLNINLKGLAAASALGIALIVGTGQDVSAQGWGNGNQRKIEKQQEKLAKQRAKLAQQRLKLERQRLQQQQAMNNRYRVYRNGSYYNTDNRGAELLRQAVNNGYQQGFRAGQADRMNRRGGIYNNSGIYRTGTYGYQSYVSSSQYQYYFRQGFQRGYEDGYNSRYRYGSNRNGSLSILGSILGSILNIQRY